MKRHVQLPRGKVGHIRRLSEWAYLPAEYLLIKKDPRQFTAALGVMSHSVGLGVIYD